MKTPVCRLCRREQSKLFLKGERCLSPKCSFTRRPYAPGKSSQSRSGGKFSDYARQLRAKQKAKTIFGVSESQFKKYYLQAAKTKGKTGETLLQLLERRLDNAVFRLGLAKSRAQARQLISHGHILINNKKVNIPSYLVRAKEILQLKDKNKKYLSKVEIPVWLKLDAKNLEAEIAKLPSREEMDSSVDEQSIVEYYSR